MSKGLALENFDVDVGIQTQAHEEYTPADDDKLMEVSHRLINKHMEAYRALGNA